MQASSSNPLFNVAREVVRSIWPSLYNRISYHRNEGRYRRMTAAVLRKCGSRVTGGPFAGMAYVGQSYGSVLAPKLLGTYEEELHPFIYRLVAKKYRCVIDIGSAEGYYAIGFARQMPEARVLAFDSNPGARSACNQMAQLNDVSDRVTVLGHCDLPALREVLTESALIVCDCEGAEADILKPANLPGLSSCDLLVETHDIFRPGVCALLEERFRLTHEIEEVSSRTRDPASCPRAVLLWKKDRQLAVNEFRQGRQSWLMMWARATTGSDDRCV